MRQYDLRLLSYCRDPHCRRRGVHAAHGADAKVLVAPRGGDAEDGDDDIDDDIDMDVVHIRTVCDDCGFSRDAVAAACGYCRSVHATARLHQRSGSAAGEASDALIAATYAAVGTYVPRAFREIHQTVIDDYGSITDRGVQRALRVLVDRRQVASLSSGLTPAWQLRDQTVRPPGFYLRYDSPKLWVRGGLRDLMATVAERIADTVELSDGVGSVVRARKAQANAGVTLS